LLLNEISSINKRYNEIAQVTGENFNIFNILKIEQKEETHSKFIAMLLDPLGAHGKGSVFLRLFLKKIRAEDFSCDNIHVETELFIGDIDSAYESGGRVDVAISNGKSQKIFIENKIGAGDQPKQLYRYSKQNPYKLIYLNPDGNKATSGSLFTLTDADYECISYKDQILSWLEECIKESVNSPLLRETLQQYSILIRKLTGQARSKKMENEIIDVITRDENSVSAYFLIRDSRINGITEKIIETKCKPALQKMAEKHGLELLPPQDYANFGQAEWGFYFKKPEWTVIEIAFPFAENLKDLWYGFVSWKKEAVITGDFLVRLKDKGFTESGPYFKKGMEDYNDWFNQKVLIELCRPDNDVIKTIEGKIVDLLKIVGDRNDI
jgi:hypothetical protein